MNFNINKIAQFSDVNIENDYFNETIKKSFNYVRFLILAFGFIFGVLSIFDLVFYSHSPLLIQVIFIRLIIFAVSVVIFLTIKKIKDRKNAFLIISLFECSIFLSYYLILYFIDAQNFLEQSMAVMVLIIINFIVPNRWINLVLISFASTITFFTLSMLHIVEVQLMSYIEVFLYIIIATIFSAMSSHKINTSNRMKYAKQVQLEISMETDKLTGISNRQKFDKALFEWYNMSTQLNSKFSLIMFDLDNFKKVNDNYGHLIGDEVLIQTCNIVINAIRNGDIFSRWGGEEFIILLPNTQLKNAVEMAERLRLNIFDATYSKELKLTCSFGVTSFLCDDSIETILNRVDSLLYMAKNSGKNKVVFEK